jgi:hypothetical protein
MPRVNLLLGEAQMLKSFERGQTDQSAGSQEMLLIHKTYRTQWLVF